MLIGLLLALLAVGCGGQPTHLPPTQIPMEPASSAPVIKPERALPTSRVVAGWEPAGAPQVYGTDNLYDLVDGQADAFFAYGFQEVAVANYQNASDASLRVEVWQMASPADAYGLFTSLRSGTPATVTTGAGENREADADPGRRLDFWQDRYVVRLFTPVALPEETLQAFAGGIADNLPSNGEPPELARRLPPEALTPRSDLFFHEEISLQSYLWLGGQNLLGLSAETEGVWARYDLGNGAAHLLLVQYPHAAAAEAALDALQAAELDNLVQAATRDGLLGAVFDSATEENAKSLLDHALGSE